MKMKFCLVVIACLLVQHGTLSAQVNNGQQFNNQQQNGSDQQRFQDNNAQGNNGLGNNVQGNNANQLVQQNPQQPDWFPIPKPHQDYLDPVLDYWATESAKVERLRSTFLRWDYNPEFVAYRDLTKNNQLCAYRIVGGQIKYSAPDKGYYEVNKIWHFGPPAEGGTEPIYKEVTDPVELEQQKEKWICDGTKIFAFNFQDKQLHEMMLPPQMQGKGLANSPFPFLFGVQTKDLKNRFWLRPVTPKDAVEQYWIEAWPKRREDAQQYKFVRVIIARKDFLPHSIQVFAPNYDEVRNPTSMAIVFNDREKNWNTTFENLNIFRKEFHNVELPYGWKKITGKLNDVKPVDPNSPEFRAMQQKNGQGIR